MINVPRRLGAVDLMQEIGRGGMGIVWLGRHSLLNRDVAVKFLLTPRTPGGTESSHDVFIEGARAAAAIRHPGITSVHDAGVAEGVPYIVMEYVRGTTIAEACDRGPIPLPIVRSILGEVADAVEHLHQSGVLHRDIKPANIMIDSRGAVLLTDFGLACRLPDSEPQGDSEPPRFTPATGGTPGYMSPEAFRGEVSKKSDLFALGVTAYELVAAHRPGPGDFDPRATPSVLTAAARQRLLDRGAPEGVIAAIERCLHPSPIFRPRSAGRFRQQVEAGFEEAESPSAPASPEEVRLFMFPEAVPQPETPAPPGPPTHGIGTARSIQDVIAARAGRREKQPDVGLTRAAPEYYEGRLIPIHWPALLGSSLAGAPLLFLAEIGALPASAKWIYKDGVVDMIWLVFIGAVSLVPGIVIYRVIAFSRANGEPGPLCGWCGYSLRGVSTEHCPECGHVRGRRMSWWDIPPAGRPFGLLRAWGLSVVMLLVISAWLPLSLQRVLVNFDVRSGWSWIVFQPASIWVGAVAALIVYHLGVREVVMLDGVERCGRCGAKGSSLRAGRCSMCDAGHSVPSGDSGEFTPGPAATEQATGPDRQAPGPPASSLHMAEDVPADRKPTRG